METITKAELTKAELTKAELTKVNHIIENLVEEHMREGYDIPAIMWTGSTRRGHNTNIWYEVKVMTQHGYTRGWTDGTLTDGMISFVEL